MLPLTSSRALRAEKAFVTLKYAHIVRNFYSRRFYSSSDDVPKELNQDLSQLKSTRGKKLKPENARFVVLNPAEAGIFKKRRIPGYFKPHNRQAERLSVLEGVEIGDKDVQLPKESNEILQEIESQRRKLLVFKSSVPKEQAVNSIHDLKPSDNSRIMSSKRYEQLKGLLDMAYTLSQLKEYVRQHYDVTINRSLSKKKLISKILIELWKCEVDETISETDDLIVERIIDVEKRDIYLLLLTNNGKILQNFARIGATLAVALNENKIIVRATGPLVKYVEVSLRKILDNVQREQLPVDDIIRNHTPVGSVPIMPPEDLISLIQKESAVYFEKLLDDDPNGYFITAFGGKRIRKAKNLLLWALDYNPQSTNSIQFLGDQQMSLYKNYPFTDISCLDWTERDKEWFRLQKPAVKESIVKDIKDSVNLNLTEEIIDELYEKLVTTADNHIAKFNAISNTQNLGITLGQFLNTSNGSNSTFQPKIANIAAQLMKLPLYDDMPNLDELYTVDQHEYYVQLKFIPDLSTTQSKRNIPPLELWFELDDYDTAINSSLRSVLHLEDRNIFLRTPQLPYDYKLNADQIVEVSQPYEENSESWLSDQPGLKSFLKDAQLTFQSRKKLFIPKRLELNLHLEGCDTPQPVMFDYVKVNYRRVLKLKYMDKYLVQFSDIKGGSGSGRYTQVDFINTEKVTRESFGNFVKDIVRFS
ncbi:LAFE_0H07536g1_1 [Lachancea fermentati]|uniref:LAFE_0H07536g1_1 n=1 Tax=Lachancea fermentati TaxID=4955 RepID=A0A1G4MJW4_LACFM|nr:LAFE_0H07536g1_1 [Lachancea fermentati]